MRNILKVAVLTTLPLVAAAKDIPTGTISVDKSLVREGVKPEVTWKVNFPSTTVDEVVDVTEEGDIKTKKRLRVDFFMIGTAVSNHRDATITYGHAGSGWNLIYSGFGKNLDPTISRYSRVVEAGQTIRVASIVDRKSNIGWIYNDQPNALVMKDGDEPNSKPGWGGDASMEDYVRPYMKDGKINIGSLDLMVALELTHTQSRINESGYDSNDSIVLVRFTEID